MMLRQSSLPSSTEADLSFASEHGEKELSCDKHPKGGHERAFPVTARKNSCGSCSTNFQSSSSQQSNVATMYENSTPAFVYQRRKQQRVSAAVLPAQASTKAKPNGNCLSVISSETPSVAAKEHIDIESRAVRAPVLLPVECTGRALISKSASVSGCSLGEEVGSVEDPKHDTLGIVDVCCVNDSCSSSKSNMVLCAAALKTEVDDTGECSSSEAFIMDGLHDDISEKDVHISILRCLGLYKGVWPIKRSASRDGPGINSNSSCLRSCKVCDQLEITIKMLICDQCEEAFHVSCCNARVRKMPLDAWFCHFCLKKKLKIMKKSLNSSTEMGSRRKAISKGALGPIAVMLEDTEPYTTNVRIGTEFQAEVSDWSGPVGNDEDDSFGEPLEMNPSKGVSFQEGNFRKPSRLSSISNWLQCLQVIEGVGGGVDGTVCGKWRRAPLFEVQTDDWECFRSVLWDPTHADCAVPQELDTDQVLKDLKYIEMLRPRVAAKKRKLGCSKSVDPEGPVDDVRNEDAL